VGTSNVERLPVESLSNNADHAMNRAFQHGIKAAFIKAAFVLFAFATATSAAQADEASIKLAGIGSRPCSYWLSNQNHRLEGTVWIYGFWSGLNYVAVSSQQDQPKTDSDAMVAAVEAACRAQPSRILATAAWAAYIDTNQQ
jgi:hypothetical protein